MTAPKLRRLTTVYTINDADAFEEENKHVFDNFKSSDGLPWAITAVSRGHELHRLALLEEAHDEKRYDLLDDCGEKQPNLTWRDENDRTKD